MKIKCQYSFYGLISIISICSLVLLACRGTHTNTRTVTNSDSATKTPQIIFLNYSIKQDKLNGEYEIKLINKTITEGKLKTISSDMEIRKSGDLECVALDKNLEPVDSILISDPLNITVESVDENNAFYKKEIARDSAQFSVRMQLNENIYAFGIKKNSHSEYQDSYLLISKIN